MIDDKRKASSMASSLPRPAVRIGDSLHAMLDRGKVDGFPNIGDSIYDLMWKRIVNLDFPPGSRLSDDALAREIGVSRTPMREALHRLSQVGLVQVNARRGFFIPVATRQDVAELYDLRIALETFATRVAAPLITPEELQPHLERQRRVRERAESTAPADVEEFVESDLHLHELLVQRGGNRRMRQILTDLKGQLSLVLLRAAVSPESRVYAIAEHGRILDALLASDVEAAVAAMTDHLQGAKRRALTGFDAA
jgi:DNA-binding GntR family transcriptional regulator